MEQEKKKEQELRYFQQANLRCHCKCGFEPKQEIVEKLNQIQEAYQKQLIVTSGARCTVYNRKIGGARLSAHTMGIAVDIYDPEKEFWKWLEDKLDIFEIWVETPDATPTWTHFDLKYRPVGRVFNP